MQRIRNKIADRKTYRINQNNQTKERKKIDSRSKWDTHNEVMVVVLSSIHKICAPPDEFKMPCLTARKKIIIFTLVAADAVCEESRKRQNLCSFNFNETKPLHARKMKKQSNAGHFSLSRRCRLPIKRFMILLTIFGEQAKHKTSHRKNKTFPI